MGLIPKLSWLLLICTLFMLLLSVWALIGHKDHGNVLGQLRKKQPNDFTYHKRQLRPFGRRLGPVADDDDDDDNGDDYSIKDGDLDCEAKDEAAEWDTQKVHQIDIKTTNLDEEEQKQRKSDRDLKHVLRQMIKRSANKVAKRQLNRIDNGPGLDFKQEFDSDEANPYI